MYLEKPILSWCRIVYPISASIARRIGSDRVGQALTTLTNSGSVVSDSVPPDSPDACFPDRFCDSGQVGTDPEMAIRCEGRLCSSPAQNLRQSPGALLIVADLKVALQMPRQVESVIGDVTGDIERFGMVKELSGLLRQAVDFLDELHRLTPRYRRSHFMKFVQAGADNRPELVDLGIRNNFCGAHTTCALPDPSSAKAPA